MPARTKNITPKMITKAYNELPLEWAILVDQMYVEMKMLSRTLAGAIITAKGLEPNEKDSEYLSHCEEVQNLASVMLMTIEGRIKE